MPLTVPLVPCHKHLSAQGDPVCLFRWNQVCLLNARPSFLPCGSVLLRRWSVLLTFLLKQWNRLNFRVPHRLPVLTVRSPIPCAHILSLPAHKNLLTHVTVLPQCRIFRPLHEAVRQCVSSPSETCWRHMSLILLFSLNIHALFQPVFLTGRPGVPARLKYHWHELNFHVHFLTFSVQSPCAFYILQFRLPRQKAHAAPRVYHLKFSQSVPVR